MNPLKQLAGQTAIYGLGTIVPRLLNYLLVPLYTRLLLPEEYGVVTELYAYIAFFFVLLMYGMETTFFRFAENRESPVKVFSTSLISIFGTSTLFILLVILFIDPIASFMQYDDKPMLIVYAAIIVGMDAFTSIQFANLRQQQKPIKFSLLKIITVSVNVGLNLYYVWFCDVTYQNNPDSTWLFLYNPELRVEYIFISNLIASSVCILLLSPQLIKLKLTFDPKLLKRMIIYAFPLLIVGVTGMVNEVLDKIIFKFLAPVPQGISDAGEYVMGQLGIYGANYKLAVLMTLFIQMFRYAAEPFFFAQAKKDNAKEVYADVMKFFVIFGLLIFLAVTLLIDVFKYFIGPEHWEGLYIVPIVLLANLFLGIFFNLSVWYKVNDLTKYGAYIALTGSVITLIFNFVLVPKYSYLGAAWGHFACYLSMMLLSYFFGKKFFPVPYPLKRIAFYSFAAFSMYLIHSFLIPEVTWIRIAAGAGFILAFLVLVFKQEFNYFMNSRRA